MKAEQLIRLYWVDSFTDKAFSGNPAAVCLLKEPLVEKKMQQIAFEIGLSETAFVSPSHDGHFTLSWFTPALQVDLCGHATLATAHALWEEELVASNKTIFFATKSGLLEASKKDNNILMNFPAFALTPRKENDSELFAALGISARPIMNGSKTVLIEVESEKTLRSIKPNFEKLKKLPIESVIVTCKSENSKFDFSSRFFAPNEGINEDPVTGFAHCHLGPYWSRKLEKQSLTAYQASQRGGEVNVEVCGERVKLGGKAVTIFSGSMSNIDPNTP